MHNPWADELGSGHGRRLAQSAIIGLPPFPTLGQSGASAAGACLQLCRLLMLRH